MNEYLQEFENLKDYGFTAETETDITPVTNEVEDLKKRLDAIRSIFLPMLENLSKDSDKPIIRWPNRGPVLQKQIEALKKLTDTKK